MSFQTPQLSTDRYLEGMVRCGRVTKVSTNNCVAATVTYPDRGFQTGYLTVLQRNTIGTQDYYCPVAGEPVWVLMQGKSLSRGLILGSAYTEDNPPPYGVQTIRGTVFADGGYVIYDTAGGGNYQINCVGKATITTGTDCDLTVKGNLNAIVSGTALVQAPTITLKGNVTVQGNLTVTGTTVMQQQATATPNCRNTDGSGGGT
jgi:phage baseplate assembly protein V